MWLRRRDRLTRSLWPPRSLASRLYVFHTTFFFRYLLLINGFLVFLGCWFPLSLTLVVFSPARLFLFYCQSAASVYFGIKYILYISRKIKSIDRRQRVYAAREWDERRQRIETGEWRLLRARSQWRVLDSFSFSLSRLLSMIRLLFN